MDKNDTPQIVFQSNQNNDINVQDYYKTFITGGTTPGDNETGENIGIDDLRGKISVSVTGQTTKNLIASLNIDPESKISSSTPNTSTPVKLVQESRCHAFYRIIGFPVVATDGNFYNPGHDIIKIPGATRSKTLKNKIQIANNVGKLFEDISSARENYVSATSQIFSSPESLAAGILSLSGLHLRSLKGTIFAIPFAQGNVDPFDFLVSDQSYSSSIKSTYGKVGDTKVPLSDYQDSNGNMAVNIDNSLTGVLSQRSHIIRPFLVDPRIDFSIGAADSKTASRVSKRIAVPFVPDSSFLKTSATAAAERPLLEKIIRDRFSQFDDTENSGQGVQDTIDKIKNMKIIQNINFGGTLISNIFSGKIFNLSQQSSFATYLSIIDNLMSKLSEAISVIPGIQGDYYWLPQPSTNGPENGGNVRDVLFNENISTNLITLKDLDIIKKQCSKTLSDINSSIASSNSIPNKSGYAFSGFFKLMSVTSSDVNGSQSSKNLDEQLKTRTVALNKAIDAMQTIEMIMGEFSGFGLCDIVAIIGALYVMPQSDLLGFLDDDAILRAEIALEDSNLSAIRRNGNLVQSLKSLESYVKGFYLIMDKIFQDYHNNNAPNSS
jgi:hypothetical protein